MDETLTLVLNGTVTLQDFATAVARFWRVVDALSRSVPGGDEIVWTVDRLDTGSAIMAVRGRGQTFAVRRVVQEFAKIGDALELGRTYEVPLLASREVADLMDVVSSRVEPSRLFAGDPPPQFRPEDGERAALLIGPPDESPQNFTALGAVEGRVQTVSSRNEYKFTLFDTMFDRAVTCYFSAQDEDTMRDAWGKLAIVEGTVTRDRVTGRPLHIRDSRVTLLPERQPGEWRRARGISPNTSGVLPEDAVRAARDAE